MRWQTVSGRVLVAPALLAATLPALVLTAAAGDGGVSMSGPTTFTEQDGAALFQTICQGCHMPDARGASGAGTYPALAHNVKLTSAAYPLYIVLKGRKGMPALASYLSDAQVATVVTYVRTHFGNEYRDGVSAQMVAAARRQP